MTHPVWQQLAEAARADGRDAQLLLQALAAWRAHPDLIEHARMFARLADILHEALDGAYGDLALSGSERALVRQWQELARWIVRRTEDAQNPLPCPQIRQASARGKHPLMRKGITDSALLSALWNAHHTSNRVPTDWLHDTGAAEHGTPAWRYARLQGHLLVGSLWAMLQPHDHPSYWAHVLPNAARAVRQASLPQGQALLARLPVQQPHMRFVQWLSAAEPQTATDAAHDVGDVPQDLSRDLATDWHYLVTWARECTHQRRQRQPARGSRSGKGKRDPVHGWVPLPEQPWLATRAIADAADDADEMALSDARVLHDIGEWLGQDEPQPLDAQQLERLGLAPHEEADALFELLDARAWGARLYAGRWAQPVRQAAAQRFAWDGRQCTPWELWRLARLLQHTLQRTAAPAQRAHDTRETSWTRQAVGILLTALVLGVSPQSARTLRALVVAAASAEQAIAHALQHPMDAPGPWWAAIVMWQPMAPASHAHAQRAEPDATPPSQPEPQPQRACIPLGWLLPALQPAYCTDIGEAKPELLRLGRPRSSAVFLPDACGFLRHWQRLGAFDGLDALAALPAASAAGVCGRSTLVFRAHEASVLPRVEQLLAALDDARVTSQRLQRVMPALLRAASGDDTLVWVTLAQTEQAQQARLYYTQHALGTIARHWQRALRTLCEQLGCGSPDAGPAPRTEPSAPAPGSEPAWATRMVGARFVMQQAVLAQLLRALQAQLHEAARRAERGLSWQALSQYHSDWLLYVLVLQLLSTGMRALRELTPPWQRWLDAGRPETRTLIPLADKGSTWHDRTRAVWLSTVLVQQYREHVRHLDALTQYLAHWGVLWHGRRDLPFALMEVHVPSAPEQGCALRMHDRNVQASWVADALRQRLGAPVPVNFARAWLRTRLLERGVRVELIDAYLGHAGQGEWPWGPLSSFDWDSAATALANAIEDELRDLGAAPVRTALVWSAA